MGAGERDLLRRIRARSAGTVSRDLRVGIGDDAAVLAPRSGEELVLTTDFSLEDVHFIRGWHPPEAVGHKCLARGLSDVAAMGARPVAFFVSLALPCELSATRQGRDWPGPAPEPWIERFYGGMLALAERSGVPLAGGDLAQVPGPAAKAAADIVVVGAVRRGHALLRSGGRAGDVLYATGWLGGAAAELRALQAHPRRFGSTTQASPEHPHLFPEPRLAAGQALARRRLATAAIDISDGLSVDLLHLCEESGLAAEVDADALPLGAGAQIEDALHGGDDYELLFAASPGSRVPKSLGGVAITPIGRFLPRRRGRPLISLNAGGRRSRLEPKGWEHF